MRICDLIKDQDTYGADADQLVLEVAQAMVARNIGAVPVLREGVLVGIFSERDLMKAIIETSRPCTDPFRSTINICRSIRVDYRERAWKYRETL